MKISQAFKSERTIKALTGLMLNEFEILMVVFEKVLYESFAARKRERSVGGGRKGALLNAREKLLFILFYIKVYPTFDVAAFLFGVTKSRPIDWVKSFMPLLEQALGRTIVMPQRQINSIASFHQHFPEVTDLFIDGTERRVQRPSTAKRQKKTYSGKKKTHTRKNMIVCDDKKRIAKPS